MGARAGLTAEYALTRSIASALKVFEIATSVISRDRFEDGHSERS
jgi:hypothetical protein